MGNLPDLSYIRDGLAQSIYHNDAEREKAEEILRTVVDEQGIGYLLDTLRTEHGMLMVDIEKVLASFGAAAFPALIAAVNDHDRHIRRCATFTLGWIDDPRAVEALLQILELEHDDPGVRKDAVEQLGNFATKPAGELFRKRIVNALVESLADQDALVRRYAGLAVLGLNDDNLIREQVALLRDEDSILRIQAVQQLGWRAAKEPDVASWAVPLVIEVLQQDPDIDVRLYAAYALGDIEDSRAVSALIDLLNDTSLTPRRKKPICDYAAELLRKIGTPEAVSAVENWHRLQDSESSGQGYP